MKVLVENVNDLPKCSSCGARIVNFNWEQFAPGEIIEPSFIECSRCRNTSTPERGWYSGLETYGDHRGEIVVEDE